MNATNFQNMMGTGPVGMAQPQGQQAGASNALQKMLIQHFTNQPPQMSMDWRSNIPPKERAGLVMELYVIQLSRATLADTFLRRTNLMLAKPDLPESQATQTSLKIEEQCYQRQTDRVSLLKI
jgi:hypothetical protein